MILREMNVACRYVGVNVAGKKEVSARGLGQDIF